MQPGGYEQALSGTLEILARSLGMIGRLDEALAKAQESVRIAEQLAKAKPGLFERAWADSLHALVGLLARLGRNGGAWPRPKRLSEFLKGWPRPTLRRLKGRGQRR